MRLSDAFISYITGKISKTQYLDCYKAEDRTYVYIPDRRPFFRYKLKPDLDLKMAAMPKNHKFGILDSIYEIKEIAA